MTLLNRTRPPLIPRADGNTSPSPGGGLGRCRMFYTSPSRARAEHRAPAAATSKLSHTEAQRQKQAAWLSMHCEVPVESALSKASRLVPGAWAAHGFWNGQAGTRGLWSSRAGPGCREGRRGDPECRMPADRRTPPQATSSADKEQSRLSRPCRGASCDCLRCKK